MGVPLSHPISVLLIHSCGVCMGTLGVPLPHPYTYLFCKIFYSFFHTITHNANLISLWLSLLVPFSELCHPLSAQLWFLILAGTFSHPPARHLTPKIFAKKICVFEIIYADRPGLPKGTGCATPGLVPPRVPDSKTGDCQPGPGKVTLVQDEGFRAAKEAGTFFIWRETGAVLRCQPGDKKGGWSHFGHTLVL